MDGRQFDDLLRSLGDNRRSLLGAALGGALGLIGLTTIDVQGKKKKGKGKKKKKKEQPSPNPPPPPPPPPSASTCGELHEACETSATCCGRYICAYYKCCVPNGATCNIDADCCEDEDSCEAGVCKRHRGDVCNANIICSDRYPYCIGFTAETFGTCQRCPADQVSTGTDEICCPSDRYCPNANGGRGACCENEGCCLPDEDGVPCGLLEHVGEGQCFGL